MVSENVIDVNMSGYTASEKYFIHTILFIVRGIQ